MASQYDDSDWFRSSTWDESVEFAFESKLRRARSTSRAQYLRIQGVHLIAQDDTATRGAGRALLQRVIDEYGEADRLQATWAAENLAEALALEGDFESAESATRELVRRRDADPESWRGARTDLDLTMAEMLLLRRTPAALEEADRWLDRSEQSVEQAAIFRNLVLRHLVARARVAIARGDAPRARGYADAALRVAAETEPSIARHPDLGRPNATTELLDELRTIGSAR
ncbi:hypothetical protein Q9R08_05525 [Microbacterium sp. QXD-8]|uniref:Tetratricopeptide repeat protein n=1 Tax=Microbacterium psychrotolerans TaxID=3068321 RepID=A0ABU0YYM3_9MICO|nr:hypothetical protein [Microbacterium sp. QXD-8]MDQ7877433.1 hypothetical protein [Microbacterium sp. QXD-8]